jgi:hypothetical protein
VATGVVVLPGQTTSSICLDANSHGTTNDTAAITSDCNGQPNQQWTNPQLIRRVEAAARIARHAAPALEDT